MVERSPEKAGVGGSTPSLATIFSMRLLYVPPQPKAFIVGGKIHYAVHLPLAVDFEKSCLIGFSRMISKASAPAIPFDLDGTLVDPHTAM